MTENNENTSENLDEEMYEEGDVLSEADKQDETDGASFGSEEDIQGGNSCDFGNSDASEDILKEAADIVDAVADLTPEEESFKDQLARERADFINFRNRAREDQAKARKYGIQDAVKDLLPVMDEIDRARAAGDLPENSPFTAISSKFEQALEKLGLTKFGAVGDVFDPSIHEAFMNRDATDGDGLKSGEVLVDNLIEAGYKQGEIVIRTAKVSTVSG